MFFLLYELEDVSLCKYCNASLVLSITAETLGGGKREPNLIGYACSHLAHHGLLSAYNTCTHHVTYSFDTFERSPDIPNEESQAQDEQTHLQLDSAKIGSDEKVRTSTASA